MYLTKVPAMDRNDSRQAGAIEVTREMALAGEEIVGEYDGKFVTAFEIATRTYQAMEAVRLASLQRVPDKD